jgi:hypothetical protein
VVPDHDIGPQDGALADHAEVADLGVVGDGGGGVDLGGGGDGHGGSEAGERRSFQPSYPLAPMLPLLALLAPTPEGYGVGLEWLVYVSLLAPILLLVLIWWLGHRRIV